MARRNDQKGKTMKNAKAKSAKEQWQALAYAETKQAAAGGANNRVPPAVAAGAASGRPWSLTEEFNKAAKKPEGPAISPNARKQVAELRKQMEAAAKGKGVKNQKQRQAIASKQGIKELRQKMSQPRNTWELTPLGSVTRGYNPNRDRQLIREIKRQQAVLDKNQGRSKAAFNKSSGMSR